MDISLRIVIVISLFCFLKVAALDEKCEIKRCEHFGPAARFPFRLKDRQPDHCGSPGFELFCNHENQTMLELPYGVKLVVTDIDYIGQQIYLFDRDGCLDRQLPILNLSASPFYFPVSIYDHYYYDYHNYDYDYHHEYDYFSYFYQNEYSFFNCSREGMSNSIDCLSIPGHHVIYEHSDYQNKFNDDLTNCSKANIKINISAIPKSILFGRGSSHVILEWSKPSCGCEAELTNISNQTRILSWYYPKHEGARIKLISTVAGSIFGSCLLALIVIGLYYIHHSDKIEKESRLKIEKFLEDYRALNPSRYSFADIKRITNQFKHKLGQGAYGTVFKGTLSNDVLVAVKLLNNIKGKGEEFINEVGSMARIHHVNVTRLIGFCADGDKRALIYEYLPNESLEKFIFAAEGENENRFLSWEKLQDIALGIAKGIEYLHQGCEQRILHFDIKPHNILLDHNFNPKISDFGLAKLCSKEQSAVSMTTARGTMGYIAPEVLSRNFGSVSHKSDVYSFGMLLLEMVGRRKNVDITVRNADEVYFPEWVYNCLEKGEEVGIRIENEAHAKIAKKLAIVGLWCIQWYPVNRPYMKAVVQMLEGEADSLTMPPNPFSSTDQLRMRAPQQKKSIGRELAAISELSE